MAFSYSSRFLAYLCTSSLTIQSTGHAPVSRVMPLMSNVRPQMQPHSRGCGPTEFTLRVVCEIGDPCTLEIGQIPSEVQIERRLCRIECNNREILLTASGFGSNGDAASYFCRLQNHLIKWSFCNSLPLSIPEIIDPPQQAEWSFMEGDFRCMEKGWPRRIIQPLLISNYGASVYPEHEFVAITNNIKLRPQRVISSNSLGKTLGVDTSPAMETGCNHLLAAVSNYTHLANSFQHVWSFLLAVTTLEMLATVTKSNVQTGLAIKQLKEHARTNFSINADVDIERIVACLNDANKESITNSVKTLVRTYCLSPDAPPEFASVLGSPEECNRKVSAIYSIRSKYSHEGRVKAKNIPRAQSFWELKAITISILKHIISKQLSLASAAVEV